MAATFGDQPTNNMNIPTGAPTQASDPMAAIGLASAWDPTESLGWASEQNATEDSRVMSLIAQELCKNLNAKGDYIAEEFVVDKDKGLAYTAHVVVVGKKGERAFAWHALPLVSSGPRTHKVTDRDGRGNDVEILLTPSDAIDRQFVTVLNENLPAKYQGFTTVYAGATTVNDDVTITETNKVAANKLLVSAFNACRVILDRKLGIRAMRPIAGLVDQMTTYIDLQFNSTERVLDDNGCPIKADTVITFGFNSRGGNVRSMNNKAQSGVFSRAFGYFDPYYSPENPNAMNPWFQNQNQPNRLWMHNLVLKGFDTDRNPRLEGILLAMYSMMALYEGSNYLNAYMPRRTMPGQIDLNNIGTLAVFSNFADENGMRGERYGKPVDIHAAGFDNFRYAYFIQMLFKDIFSITLDMPATAPRSWLGLPFRAATENTTQGAAAVKSIVDTLDYLTDKRFSMAWGSVGQPGAQQSIFEHVFDLNTGWYVDAAGQRQDIDNIMNTIALTNACYTNNIDLDEVYAYQDVMLNTQLPSEARLQKYRKLADLVTGQTVTWTGTTRRGVLSENFLKALAVAFNGTGIQTSIRSQYNNDQGRQHAMASFAQNYHGGHAGMFNQYQRPNQWQGGMGAGQNQWSIYG